MGPDIDLTRECEETCFWEGFICFIVYGPYALDASLDGIGRGSVACLNKLIFTFR